MRPSLSRTRFQQVLSIAAKGTLGITSVFAIFTAAYFITTAVASWRSWHFSGYMQQMTTMITGFVLLAIVGTTVSRLVGPRQHAMWQSLIDALRGMAKGNFDVHLDVGMIREPGGDEHPFRVLVHSINDMAQELAELEHMRQEFISNVSHEIQSPLTSITGFATAIRSGTLSDEQRERYLEIIEKESKRLSRLSDNLLKLTSLESGYHPFHPEKYRLDRQIRDAILAYEPSWLPKEIEVDVALPAIDFEGDRDLLSQVWQNLFVNAIKFTPERGSIKVSAQVDDGWVSIRIVDSGIGMSEADKSRIFERFFKADKSRTNQVTGAGLGLSIVKKIVDLHGGNIDVETQLGTGSAFIVSLPTEVKP